MYVQSITNACMHNPKFALLYARSLTHLGTHVPICVCALADEHMYTRAAQAHKYMQLCVHASAHACELPDILVITSRKRSFQSQHNGRCTWLSFNRLPMFRIAIISNGKLAFCTEFALQYVEHEHEHDLPTSKGTTWSEGKSYCTPAEAMDLRGSYILV